MDHVLHLFGAGTAQGAHRRLAAVRHHDDGAFLRAGLGARIAEVRLPHVLPRLLGLHIEVGGHGGAVMLPHDGAHGGGHPIPLQDGVPVRHVGDDDPGALPGRQLVVGIDAVGLVLGKVPGGFELARVMDGGRRLGEQGVGADAPCPALRQQGRHLAVMVGAGGVVHEPPLKGMVHIEELVELGAGGKIEEDLPDGRETQAQHQGDDGAHEEQAEGRDADEQAVPRQKLGHRRKEAPHRAAHDSRRDHGGPLVVHRQDAHRHHRRQQGAGHQGEGLPRQQAGGRQQQPRRQGHRHAGAQGRPLLVGGGDHEGSQQDRCDAALKEGEDPAHRQVQHEQQAQPHHDHGREGGFPFKEQQIQTVDQVYGQQIQQEAPHGAPVRARFQHVQGHQVQDVLLGKGRPLLEEQLPLLNGHRRHVVRGGGAGLLRLHLVHHGGGHEKLVDQVPGQLRLADGGQAGLLHSLLGPVAGGFQLAFLHAGVHPRQDGILQGRPKGAAVGQAPGGMEAAAGQIGVEEGIGHDGVQGTAEAVLVELRLEFRLLHQHVPGGLVVEHAVVLLGPLLPAQDHVLHEQIVLVEPGGQGLSLGGDDGLVQAVDQLDPVPGGLPELVGPIGVGPGHGIDHVLRQYVPGLHVQAHVRVAEAQEEQVHQAYQNEQRQPHGPPEPSSYARSLSVHSLSPAAVNRSFRCARRPG